MGEGPLHSVTKVALGWGSGGGDERLGEQAEIAFQTGQVMWSPWSAHSPPTPLFLCLEPPASIRIQPSLAFHLCAGGPALSPLQRCHVTRLGHRSAFVTALAL